ncbi:MAG TPA: HPr family phosphocarrier protein [Alphaproteobacteria bacterium]|nr:HPr family phosphocarrier protein [Alphaproteobacteria bacterium]
MDVDGPAAPPMFSRDVVIVNRRGLHARAAAKFVKLAAQFDARVLVARSGMEVGGDSIMGLMMLAAGPGSIVTLTADGPDAQAALDALQDLVARKFDED